MRITILAALAVGLPHLAAAAGTPTFTLGTVYQCANGQSFVVVACAGPADTDACDVQSFQGGRPFMRGKSSRAQVLALVPQCAAQAAASPSAGPAAGPAGVDRAYHVHDKVQVNAQGVGWMDGEIVSMRDGIETEYKVAVSGNRFLLATYHDLRFVAAAPPPPAFQPGVAPKSGLVSCAGKFEGRYGPPAGPGPTIVFRAGKATLREPDVVMTDGKMSGQSSEKEGECWTGGGQIFLRWLDGSHYDFPIDINDDGTLDTPEGPVKKKGS